VSRHQQHQRRSLEIILDALQVVINDVVEEDQKSLVCDSHVGSVVERLHTIILPEKKLLSTLGIRISFDTNPTCYALSKTSTATVQERSVDQSDICISQSGESIILLFIIVNIHVI
jgi:hypothetical protein